MQITKDEYKQYIKDEYIRAYTHYQAMILLAEQEGIDDVPTPEPSPGPTPEPTPTPTPTPEPTPTPTGEPEFVYNGAAEYTIAKGEHAKFTIYVNNATSSDFQTTVPGDPECIRADDKWSRTSNGYKADVDIKGVNRGVGQYCLYWRKDEKSKDKWLIINVKVTG